MTLQIVSITDFLTRLTGGKLTISQLNRTAAYLRAKKIVFYDDFSRSHCALLDTLKNEQAAVIAALRLSLTA